VDREQLKAILENILFIADAPVSMERLAGLFGKEIPCEEIEEALAELRADYEGRNLFIAEVAEGFRMQTKADYAPWITQFFKMEKGQRLGRAALEVLAIIAYRQPITRAEVDEVRGVDSGAVLRGLVEKNLVKAMGRRKAPGKPMMYGTTKRFLEYFGLSKLADLPTMEEFQREMEDAFGPTSQQMLEFEEGADAEAMKELGDEVGEEIAGEDSEASEDSETGEAAGEGEAEKEGYMVIERGFEPDDDEEEEYYEEEPDSAETPDETTGGNERENG